MRMHASRTTRLIAVAVGLAAALSASLLLLRGSPAEAQGVMSAPACQCSATTAIPGLSTSIVHCLCGGMSCVISEHTGPGRNTNLMQCVR